MTLQWLSVAAFLYTEIGLGLLLSLDFISNARWKSIFTSRILKLLKQYGAFLFSAFVLMMLVLFCDSAYSTWRFSKIDNTHVDLRNNPQAEIQAHMKLFRAQRNLYITGFSLFMLIVLRRLAMLISKQANVEASHQAILKQAEGAAEQASKLMKENDDLLKGNRTHASESTKVTEEKKAMEERIIKLEEELDESKKKLASAENDMEAMKAQSEGLHREYDRILDEHNKMEKKLAILGNLKEGVISGEEKKDL